MKNKNKNKNRKSLQQLREMLNVKQHFYLNLLRAFQDRYGVNHLKQLSQRTNFTNRYRLCRP